LLAGLRRIFAALLAVLVRIASGGGFGLVAVIVLFVLIMVMAGVIFGIAILGVKADQVVKIFRERTSEFAGGQR
jgi:predicted exporter